MRKRWIWDAQLRELVPIEERSAPDARVYIQGDLQPYRSMCDGTMVEGRAQHREHLKRHNVVEIGDAYDKKLPTPEPLKSPKGLRERLHQVANSKLR